MKNNNDQKKNIIDKWISDCYEEIDKNLRKGKFEISLCLIKSLASMLYDYNQIYFSKRIENYITYISTKFDEININGQDKIVLFYDGFGLDNRGLAQIYLNAISLKYKIIYVCLESKIKNIPIITSIVEKSGGIVLGLKTSSYIEEIKKIQEIIREFKPKNIFVYTFPSDVSACTVLNTIKEGTCIRFLINLTDHAFWLGASCIDYCIEFREYGIYLSNKYREINKDKLIMIPYYPIINNYNFQGFPFEFDPKNQKLIVSGGSVYKTIDDANTYYKFIRRILDNFNDAIFWYLGDYSKYDDQLNSLCNDYPSRVHRTPERKDIFEILKRSFLYINSYPIGGGLMVQYAVLAGTIPIMVRRDDNSSGVLIEQNRIGIMNSNFEEAFKMVTKLFNEDPYYQTFKKSLKDSVISPLKFNDQVLKTIQNERSDYNVSIRYQDVTPQKQLFYNLFNIECLDRYFVDKRNPILFFSIPNKFLHGLIYKIKCKIIDKFNK